MHLHMYVCVYKTIIMQVSATYQHSTCLQEIGGKVARKRLQSGLKLGAIAQVSSIPQQGV